MKTIFITSFHPLISRSILNTGVLRRILATNIRVVLLVPPAKVAYFTEVFKGKGVLVEGVTVSKKPLEGIIMFFSFGLVNIHNHLIRAWKSGYKWPAYIAIAVVHRTLGHISILRVWLRYFGQRYFATKDIDALVAKYTPDLVFTTDIFYREDRTISIIASRKGIKTVAMVRSWDNATTKGVFFGNPIRIITVNEVLKKELITIHRIDPNIITVTGWPHYDSVLEGPHVSREQFYKTMGLRSDSKTILFAPGGNILYKHDREILIMFKRLLDAGRFVYPVQFLVRFPPADTVDTSPIDNDPRFIIDDPGTNVTGRKKDIEISAADNIHLENTLHHVDIVVTIVSTMTIDGAVFGKPVVVIGFDAPGATRQGVRTLAAYPHFSRLLKTGLVTHARTEDEFVDYINAYLDDPKRSAATRAEIVSRYAYRLDGKSAERVAARVLAEL